MPGLPEIVIIAVVAFIVLVVFGNRLPSTMRNLGRGIVEFKKGARGVTDELEDAIKDGEEATSKREENLSTALSPIRLAGPGRIGWLCSAVSSRDPVLA